ncbi:hypothetical protein H8959_016622 [Pygathrix nigripes]
MAPRDRVSGSRGTRGARARVCVRACLWFLLRPVSICQLWGYLRNFGPGRRATGRGPGGVRGQTGADPCGEPECGGRVARTR